MKDLVFIPARAGSKGIKNKNLAKINNKPLIAHTIDFIKKIPKLYLVYFYRWKKIYNISKKLGFRFNYLRPKKLVILEVKFVMLFLMHTLGLEKIMT